MDDLGTPIFGNTRGKTAWFFMVKFNMTKNQNLETTVMVSVAENQHQLRLVSLSVSLSRL